MVIRKFERYADERHAGRENQQRAQAKLEEVIWRREGG